MIENITGCKLEHNMQGDNIASIQQLLDPGYAAEDQRTRHFALRCAYMFAIICQHRIHAWIIVLDLSYRRMLLRIFGINEAAAREGHVGHV